MASVSVTKSVASGSEAKGSAIASAMISELKQQAGALKRFLQEIYELDHAGRKAFRVAVSHFLKKMRATVLTKEGTAEHSTFKKTAASAGARMSEAVSFSKACDAGYQPKDLNAGSYHYQVSLAREFANAEAAAIQVDADGNVIEPVGPTRRRGRKATPFIDKIKNLVNKDKPSIDDVKLAAEMLAQMAEIMHKAETKAKRAKLDEAQTKEAMAQAIVTAQEQANAATVH